jgi:hypothetical protein
MLRYLPLIILFGITIYALVECAQTDQEQVRNLPKWGWILIIILFGPQTLALGPIGWFVAGRPKGKGFGGGFRQKRKIVPPDDNPDFLKGL